MQYWRMAEVSDRIFIYYLRRARIDLTGRMPMGGWMTDSGRLVDKLRSRIVVSGYKYNLYCIKKILSHIDNKRQHIVFYK